MVQKSKLELQIEAAQKKVQEEQRRLKQLQNQHSEKERKARNHRLCKRHGFLESVLPETINLTDEQFETFVKQHIANHYGIRAIVSLTGQSMESITAKSITAEKQNGNGNTPTGTPQNNGTPTNSQGATSLFFREAAHLYTARWTVQCALAGGICAYRHKLGRVAPLKKSKPRKRLCLNKSLLHLPSE